MSEGEGRVRGNSGSRLAKQAKMMRRLRYSWLSLLASSEGCSNSDIVERMRGYCTERCGVIMGKVDGVLIAVIRISKLNPRTISDTPTIMVLSSMRTGAMVVPGSPGAAKSKGVTD